MGAMPTNPEAQFHEAIQRFGPALQRMARGYEADPAAQEELKQEILLHLWRAMPSFRQEASLRTFVFRIAHNIAIKHVHKHARDLSESGLEVDKVQAPTMAPESSLDRSRMREALTAAIRKLPTVDREVVLLNLEGLSNVEVADVTGLSVSNVGTRLSRLRAVLIRRVGGVR